MTIAILVHGPDFACSENLTHAFSLWDETRLISLNESDWRDYDPGLVVSQDTLEEARTVARSADLLVLGDATAIKCLARLGGAGWIGWAQTRRIIAFYGDTAYHHYPAYHDGLCREIGVRRLFLLPNLLPLTTLEAVPLHHPMPVAEAEKAERLTAMHSPGRDGKAIAKGTPAIEEVIGHLQATLDFDYRRLMHLTLEDCLRIKATAHAVIDQMPAPGDIHGLGRSGLEALAAGSVVVSAMYDTGVLRGFFDPPPVVDARTPEALESKLRKVLQNGALRERLAVASLDWAQAHIAFEPWLDYVGAHL